MTSFKQSGIWKIEDANGNDEVVMTRTFGNESIRLIFSIQDIQSQEHEPEFEEDAAEDHVDDPIQTYGVRVAISITKVFELHNFILSNAYMMTRTMHPVPSASRPSVKRVPSWSMQFLS